MDLGFDVIGQGLRSHVGQLSKAELENIFKASISEIRSKRSRESILENCDEHFEKFYSEVSKNKKGKTAPIEKEKIKENKKEKVKEITIVPKFETENLHKLLTNIEIFKDVKQCSQFFLTCEFSNEKLRENLISKLKDLSYSELLHNKTVKEDFQNFQGYLSSIGLTSQKSSASIIFLLHFLLEIVYSHVEKNSSPKGKKIPPNLNEIVKHLRHYIVSLHSRWQLETPTQETQKFYSDLLSAILAIYIQSLCTWELSHKTLIENQFTIDDIFLLIGKSQSVLLDTLIQINWSSFLHLDIISSHNKTTSTTTLFQLTNFVFSNKPTNSTSIETFKYFILAHNSILFSKYLSSKQNELQSKSNLLEITIGNELKEWMETQNQSIDLYENSSTELLENISNLLEKYLEG